MRILYIFLGFFLFFSFSLSAETGKDIFDRYCTVCHSPSMASMFGAPAAHDLNAWTERKENAFKRAVADNGNINSASEVEKKMHALNELVKTAIAGTDKGMPPKGTCTDCTDDELRIVIEFMSAKVD